MNRPLSTLLSTDEPAWPELRLAIDSAKNQTTIIAPDPAATDDLHKLQITVHSTLGAMIIHTGGLLIDHGWVRLLGSYSARMARSLVRWNEDCGRRGLFLVGDDIVGGAFAINGGALGGTAGNVSYFSPDTMTWEDLGRGYSSFVRFLLEGDLEKFYGGSRWTGWQGDDSSLAGDQAYSIYPLLGTEETSIDQRSRRAVPLKELMGLFGAIS